MWLKLYDTAPQHPKIIKLARELGVSRATALGHLGMLWLWTLRMAPDGNLASFEPDDIEIGAEWDGGQGVFVRACTKCKLLDETEDGLEVHDWDAHSERLKAAKRKREERKRKQRVRRDIEKTRCHVTSQDVTDVSRDVTGRHAMSQNVTQEKRREEKRREEKRGEHTAQSSGAAPASAPAKSPTVVSMPLNAGPDHPVTQEDVDRYRDTYPAVDVVAELKRARQWLHDNPKRRKTKGGIARYLNNWLGRVQDGHPSGKIWRNNELDDLEATTAAVKTMRAKRKGRADDGEG